MIMNFNTRISSKRDTESNWSTTNPVLLDGEIISVVMSTGEIKIKVGDGTTTYNSLPFVDPNMSGATSSAAGSCGLVPAPVAGNQKSFLRGDGTWITPDNTLNSTSTNPVQNNTIYTALNSKQNTINVRTVTLNASSWSSNIQTISVIGVTTSNVAIISPIPSSYTDYCDAGIRCTVQGSGTLTFACEDPPSVNIDITVVII